MSMLGAITVIFLATISVVALKNAGPVSGFKQDTIDIRRGGNVVDAFKLQVGPANQVTPVSRPVTVTVKLINVSEISRFIELTYRPACLYMVVRHSNGRFASLTDLGRERYSPHIDERPYILRLFLPNSYRDRMRGIAGSTVSYAVSGGGSQDFNIEVSEFYDMSQPDTYTVESEIPLVTTKDSLVGNVVTVEVR